MMFSHHVIQRSDDELLNGVKNLGNSYYMYTGLFESCEGL